MSEKEAETAAVEERCTHLVRLGEQRNQEIKTLQAQLVGVQDRAKDMLLSQASFLPSASACNFDSDSMTRSLSI